MKVAAVFCTMNRVDTAEECLRRLAAQSIRPQMVVVTDNASTDGTQKRLEALGDLGFQFELIRSEENLGNAGGVALAMERAFDLAADAVWVLDDDSWPKPEALSALLFNYDRSDGMLSSQVLDPATGMPSWPYQVEEGGKWVTRTDFVAGEQLKKIRRAWLGVLIPRRVYETVGPVNGELFLRGEDEDYPRRIEQAGFSFFLVPDSVLHHPPGGELSQLRVLGSHVVLEKGLGGKKLYYRLRNAWWMKRRDSGLFAALVLASAHLALLGRGGTLCDNRRVIARAARDAWNGQLGRCDDLP